jgi:hypothetical protein
MIEPSLHSRSCDFEIALTKILGASWWATLPNDPRHRTCVVAARLNRPRTLGVLVTVDSPIVVNSMLVTVHAQILYGSPLLDQAEAQALVNDFGYAP